MKKYLLLGFLWVFSTIIVHAQISPPILNPVSGVSVDNPFTLIFTDDGTWQSLISVIRFGNDVIDPSAYDTSTTSGKIVFTPSASIYFQNDTTIDITIVTDISYFDGVFSQTIGHGIPNKLGVFIEPIADLVNGSVFSTQPVIEVQDQYGNRCTGDTSREITVAKADAGVWTLAGTLVQNANAGILTYSDLSATSNVVVSTAQISFSANVTGINSAIFNIPLTNPPSLNAASGVTVDDPFTLTFANLNDWQNKITSITYGGASLSGAYNVGTNDQIVFTPSASTALQSAGTTNLVFVASGFSSVTLSQTIGHGDATKFIIQTQPSAPATNGGELAIQPVVSLQDQFSNACTNDGTSSVGVVASGATWNLGGTTPQTATSGVVSFSGLTGSSVVAVTGATITFSLDGFTFVSDSFDIPVNAHPTLVVPSDAIVDTDFEITFVVDDITWRDSITEIQYGTDALPIGAYDLTQTNKIILKPSQSAFLQVPATKNLTIVSSGYADAVESLEIKHGAATKFVITTQPSAPATNGGELATQPSVSLQDQFSNACTSDGTSSVGVVASGATWNLGGTTPQIATGGVVSFTGLTGSSNVAETGATITFSLGSFTLESDSFDIPVNAHPTLVVPTDATVDTDFEITFVVDDITWRDSITEIRYGADVLPIAAYDKTVANTITIMPAQSVFLQVPATQNLTIVSSGYADAVESLEIKHGVATKFVITTQPSAPATNGGELATQPVVKLQDQYNNDCTGDGISEIIASESGGTWFLDGVKQVTASGGEFAFTGLQARSDTEIIAATITFTSGTLPELVSTSFTIPSLQTAPNLIASSTATVDNVFEIGFAENITWQSTIDSITYGGAIVDELAYDKSQSAKIIFTPGLDADLQNSGTASMVVYARGFTNASVSQEIKHGVASDIAIVLQPTAPAENGSLLANQPVLTLKDQYANDCTSENTIEITVAKGDANIWTLGGTLTKQVTNGSVSFTDLTASSSVAITAAYIAFSASGLTTVNSNTFDIPDLTAPPVLTAASDVTVDSNFDITFTDNPTWRSQITEIKYGTEVLSAQAYDTSAEGIITFKPAESPALQTVTSEYIYIVSTSFLKDSVLQAIGHGAATSIVITTQPQQPANNAGLLQTQPGVKIQDQYLNDCTTNSVQEINANATGGSWVVEGTTSLMVTNGIVDFTDLTARSTDRVTDATITFSGTGLTSQESATFIIPAPLIAPSLIASITATVDSLFDVTFSENASWKELIDSISFGGNVLISDVYDKNIAGKLIFDPSKSTELQVTGTKEILVYSRGYQNATVNQEIKHGIPDTIFIDRQPTAPLVNGGSLDTQPKVSVRDQYNNNCGSNDTFEITATNGDAQAWTLGGIVSQSVTAGVLTYSDLTASSETAVAGAFIIFAGEGLTSVNSDLFDIVELLNPPNINAVFQVTVDADFTLNFFATDNTWRNSLTAITYEGDTLPASAYTLGTETIVFHISQEVLLQKAGTFNIVIHSLGYTNVIVEQEVGHGAIASMEITQQPMAPLTNGDRLEQQPILHFLDQYANECTSEIQKSITVSRNDAEDWSLAGIVEQTATNGIVTFTDLSAYSLAAITGAELQFTSTDLTSVVSSSFTIPDVSSAPVLNVATDATVDNPFKISFTEDSVWRSRINVVTVNDSILSAASYNTSQVGELELIPAESEFLQKSGSFQIIVQSRGFAHDTVQQDINHGAADSLLITSQPVDPELNGDTLAQQPVLKLSDQYLNDCIGDNATLVDVVKYDQKAWTLGGTLQAQSVSGMVSFSDLTATSEIAIDSAYLQFSFDKDTVISSLFKIPVPIIELILALDVTVDNEFTIQASDNASWRDSISAISFAGEILVDTSYLIEAGGIIFYPDRDSILQIARTDTIIVVANGYANAIVEQSIKHGVAIDMAIIDQPIDPENNGDTLAQQPKLQLKDQYKNDCENDNFTQILTSKYSDGSETDVVDLWDLGGVKTITAIEGLVTYLNLTASSENRVEGARLLFTSDALPNVVSDSFDIVIPLPPVIMGAVNTNVDESFFVEFTDNKTWRSLIFDIRYGIRSLEGNYDISEPGKITFDPTVTSILQKSGIDSMYIYSGNYDTVRFEQTIHHGKSKYLVIVKEPSAPLTNGDAFLRQPQLKLQDQYRNNCDTDNETPIAVKKGDAGDWALAGTFTQIAVDGLVKYTDLFATSEREVEGARLEFEGTGIIPKLSQSFTIPEPQENRAGEAKANPELVCYGASSSITLVGFDGVIQWQKYDESNEIYEDINGENSEIFISDDVVVNAIYRALVSKEGFTTQYSNSVTVSPIEPPLADFTFEINYNQVDFVNLSVNATTIVWDFGDGIISSEFEPSHSFALDNINGSGYVVSLTASNDACPDSKKSQQVFITTGIEDLIAETGIVVYPNPSKGEFFIKISNSDQDGVLRIFDQAGKLVAARNIENGLRNNRIAFDLKNLTSGIYFLTIQYSDKVVRSKLIIQ